jgi:hypothetical protein
MARKKRPSKKRGRQTAMVPRNRVPTLVGLLNRPGLRLEKADVALVNLLCAAGLPGAENLEITRLLETVDEWAELVRLETERKYDRFIDAPGSFNNSQAYFCVLYMITVLQTRCGVRYNPKWTCITPDKPIPREFGGDARDLFIHAIIDGTGGTCGSLPVLYAAVGRRLGYPLKIVKAYRHLFLRWDDPKGEHWFYPDRFNIEATGPGIHCLPDEHYKTWPHKVPPEDIEAGIFLKSLTPRQELAEFISARAHCIMHYRRLADATKAMRKAVELAPHNTHFRNSYEDWEARRKILARGHLFLSNPVEPPDYTSKGPRWIKTPDGQRLLVQTLRPGGFLPFVGTIDVGRPLVRKLVQMPNGHYAEADLPLHGSGERMEAHWLPIPGGDYALVHRPLDGRQVPKQEHNASQPILPDESFSPYERMEQGRGYPSRLMPWDENKLTAIIQRRARQEQTPPLAPVDALSLPPGPIPPRLETTSPQLTVL